MCQVPVLVVSLARVLKLECSLLLLQLSQFVLEVRHLNVLEALQLVLSGEHLGLALLEGSLRIEPLTVGLGKLAVSVLGNNLRLNELPIHFLQLVEETALLLRRRLVLVCLGQQITLERRHLLHGLLQLKAESVLTLLLFVKIMLSLIAK